MKKYIHLFRIKYVILTLAIFILQHAQFSLNNGFYIPKILYGAQMPPDEPAMSWSELFGRVMSGGGTPEGTYFNDGGGFWSYCPECAFHISVDEVTVYGSFSGSVSNYAPSNTSYSNFWHYTPSPSAWNYWEYGGGSSGTGTWKPDPNPLPPINPLPCNPIELTVTTQDSSNWCMFACAEALADYFGCSANQYSFAADYWSEYEYPPDSAASWGYFNAHYLNNSGFNNYPPTEEELVEALDDGWPVLARVDNGGGQAHAVVIYRYIKSGRFVTFRVMNPDPSIGIMEWTRNDLNDNLMEDTQITIVKGITNCPNQ